MRKWAAGLVWAGVGLCGTSFGTLACVGQACTLIGCNDTEQLTFSVAVAQVSDTDLSACRSGRCAHARISAADLTTITAHRRIQLEADDGVYAGVECLIDTPLPPGSARFTLIWDVGQAEAPVAAGDVLNATFNDSSGNAAVSETGTIGSFEEYYPNGKDCDKVGCRTGTVEGSAH